MPALEDLNESQFAITHPATLADFEAFIEQPENDDKIFELINGEIVAVPSNPYASSIAGQIFFFVRLFLEQYDLGRLTVPDGGYIIRGNVYSLRLARTAAHTPSAGL